MFQVLFNIKSTRIVTILIAWDKFLLSGVIELCRLENLASLSQLSTDVSSLVSVELFVTLVMVSLHKRAEKIGDARNVRKSLVALEIVVSVNINPDTKQTYRRTTDFSAAMPQWRKQVFQLGLYGWWDVDEPFIIVTSWFHSSGVRLLWYWTTKTYRKLLQVSQF